MDVATRSIERHVMNCKTSMAVTINSTSRCRNHPYKAAILACASGVYGIAGPQTLDIQPRPAVEGNSRTRESRPERLGGRHSGQARAWLAFSVVALRLRIDSLGRPLQLTSDFLACHSGSQHFVELDFLHRCPAPSSGSRSGHFPFAFSPSSTRRRMASESFGLSGCCFAHFSIALRRAASARKPIMGVVPVGGRPIFRLADIAFFILSV